MDDTAGRLTVDLGAVVANWHALGRLHPMGEVAGVVKADGYGLGAAAVAGALRDAGCARFFVAHLSEGMALRAALGAALGTDAGAGPGAAPGAASGVVSGAVPAIAVLNGFPPGADGEAGLLPVLNHLGDVAAWSAAARRDGRARPVLLHLDTGMNRLGLEAAEVARLEREPALLDGLEVLHAMTHLACADEPEHPLNRLQPARFHALCDRLLPGVARSLANSSGIFLPGTGSDLARPGCALYGINPVPGRANPMRPVARLDAPVLQVRVVPAGESAGYGAAWVAPRPTRVATVAAGYADGYLRSLSGRGVARHGGRDAPLLGRVSMDLSLFDVTDLPEIEAGHRLVLLGPEPGIDADAQAARAGTIGYEVLTSLGPRYRRDYLPA